ncbi:3-hydroxyacyl-CoA dehydrogenase family protein [Streptomyces sp. NBC_01320]|uniref:3-hydroxyacyl-CoA dehydrogenase family protein n=1 Tax=Streptomyces sp. NBC_01320 TaxID=2903824 RepID=UPI002E114D36|nr:3-hydroxyacyl-CoA dehydrogenase NAD-binding domain-containing protein [Streptomyces sp. NBC_01320]
MAQVAVVGTGTTGTRIAEVCAAAGTDVVLYDANIYAALSAIQRITAAHRPATAPDERGGPGRDVRFGRLTFAAGLSDVSGSDIVIEAVPELLDLKVAVLRSVEDVTRPGTLLVTSTSALPITNMATQLRDPRYLVGLNFFAPAPITNLIEVVSTTLTPDVAWRAAIDFVEKTLGKVALNIADQPTFC